MGLIKLLVAQTDYILTMLRGFHLIITVKLPQTYDETTVSWLTLGTIH